MANLLDRFGLRDLAFTVSKDLKDVAVARLETAFDENVQSRLQTLAQPASPVQQMVSDTGREFTSGGKAVPVQDPRSLAQGEKSSTTAKTATDARMPWLRPLLIGAAVVGLGWLLLKGGRRVRK